MWKVLTGWLAARNRRKLPVSERLDEQAKREALEQARFLFARGVSVREVAPGEDTDASPEIGVEPIAERRG